MFLSSVQITATMSENVHVCIHPIFHHVHQRGNDWLRQKKKKLISECIHSQPFHLFIHFFFILQFVWPSADNIVSILIACRVYVARDDRRL